MPSLAFSDTTVEHSVSQDDLLSASELEKLVGPVALYPDDVLAVLLPASSFGYWVWTPKTGKWVNPKYAVKDTPKEQMEWAMWFYESGEYKRAISELEKLIENYPNSIFSRSRVKPTDARYSSGALRSQTSSSARSISGWNWVPTVRPSRNRVRDCHS